MKRARCDTHVLENENSGAAQIEQLPDEIYGELEQYMTAQMIKDLSVTSKSLAQIMTRRAVAKYEAGMNRVANWLQKWDGMTPWCNDILTPQLTFSWVWHSLHSPMGAIRATAHGASQSLAQRFLVPYLLHDYQTGTMLERFIDDWIQESPAMCLAHLIVMSRCFTQGEPTLRSAICYMTFKWKFGAEHMKLTRLEWDMNTAVTDMWSYWASRMVKGMDDKTVLKATLSRAFLGDKNETIATMYVTSKRLVDLLENK
jgi:hypothetical protein